MGQEGPSSAPLWHSELPCGFLVILQGIEKWLWCSLNPVRDSLESEEFDMDSPPTNFSSCCCALSLFRKYFTQLPTRSSKIQEVQMYVNQNQKFLLSLGVLKFLHPPDMLQDSYKQPTALADTLLYSLAGLLPVPGFVGVL